MTKLQSGISSPSSATDVANRQLSLPLRKFIMVSTCWRKETFRSPASPLRVPTYLCERGSKNNKDNTELTKAPANKYGVPMCG